MNLTQIEIYPTNQYTPAVHRLLQVTANIYDATSTNHFPAVFRPLFNVDAFGDVYLIGYTNVPCVSDPSQLSAPIEAVTLATTPNLPAVVVTNVYNVPWIIAARKGFPTFNEFVGENMVGFTRRLQFTRNTSGAMPNQLLPILQTNQMYLLSVSSSGGLDFWNSYTNNFTDPVTVAYRVITFLSLTNSDASAAGDPGGVVPSVPWPLGYFSSSSVSFSGWPGTGQWIGGQPNTNSFYIPMNFVAFSELSNAVYRTPYASVAAGTLPSGFSAPSLVWTNYFNNVGQQMLAIFETNVPAGQQFYVPQWGLLTTNQLQVYILDKDSSGTNHVIDYVNLDQSGSQDLNNEIFSDDGNAVEPQGIWNTNIDVKRGIPWGIYNQINISKGLESIPTEDGTWQGDPEASTYGSSIQAQQADFAAFFFPYGATATVNDSYGMGSASNLDATVQAPYAPTRYAVGYTVWVANDPLVHYTTTDLKPRLAMNIFSEYNNSISNVPPPVSKTFQLGQLSYDYSPWGGNPFILANSPQSVPPPQAIALMQQDSLIYSSDDWDFPTNQMLNTSWLGRVHRGTPWQTIYLKSADILQEVDVSGGVTNHGVDYWQQWIRDANMADATNMAPVQDWNVVGILAAMFNTNNFTSLVSVNDPNTNDWLDVLDGLMAVTNSTPAEFLDISADSPQASTIVSAIQALRMNQPAGYFLNLGDILATPQLSMQSPFLDLAATSNITDEEYEAIPSQLLSLLRVDSVGTAVSASGQVVFQFTGDDSQSYAIEASSDLVNWTSISTNNPVNGVFTFTNSPSVNGGAQFFRSVLVGN
ncbi:MAG TPA: hypothetical protein VGI03_03625 [Verrucomicrobiae bacterium]